MTQFPYTIKQTLQAIEAAQLITVEMPAEHHGQGYRYLTYSIGGGTFHHLLFREECGSIYYLDTYSHNVGKFYKDRGGRNMAFNAIKKGLKVIEKKEIAKAVAAAKAKAEKKFKQVG